jgi:TolA-binding protein
MLEINATASPSDQNFKPLLQQYNAFLKAYPNDKDWCSVFLYRAAQRYYQVGNYSEVVNLLERANKNYANANTNEMVMLFLATILDEQKGDYQRVSALSEEYKTRYPKGKYVRQFKLFELPLNQRLNSRIETLLKEFEASKGSNHAIGQEAIQAISTYIVTYQDSTNCPHCTKYLTTAAQICSTTGNPMGAISFYNIIQSKYPDSTKTAEIDLRKAQIFENDLKDFEAAKETYNKIIKESGNSELTKVAKQALSLLGKSPSEILNKSNQ